MFKKQNKKHKKFYGFTLVELIIVITILAILATISFVSFSGYTSKSRDSNRLFSLKEISKALEIQKEMTGNYPQPDDIYAYGGIPSLDETLFSVGLIGKNVSNYIKLGSIPLDPKTGNEYLYGVTRDNKNFQIAGTLENLQSSIIVPVTYADAGMQAVVEGNYKGVIKFSTGSSNYIGNIPSIIFSRTGTYDELRTFVINKGKNLPYSVDGEKLGTGLSETEVLKELHNKDSLTLTGVIVTNPKSETEIKEISDKLGVPDLVVAENLGNNEYVQKYTSTGGNGGANQNEGSSILKLIDFENPADYSITNSVLNDYFTNVSERPTVGNFGELTTVEKISGENGFKFFSSNFENSSCVEFNFNTDKNFVIEFSYKYPSLEGMELNYKKDGVFNNNWESYTSYSDMSSLYFPLLGSEQWQVFKTNQYDKESYNFSQEYFLPGSYQFNLCAFGGEGFIDDIKIIEHFIGTCAIQPNYSNAIFDIGSPESLLKPWQNTDSEAGCYYECKLGFGGNDCNDVIELSFYDKLFYDLTANNIKFSYYNLFDKGLYSYNNNPNYYIHRDSFGSDDYLFRDMNKDPVTNLNMPRYIGQIGTKVYYTDSNKLRSYDLINGNITILDQYLSYLYIPKDGILSFDNTIDGLFYVDLGDGNINQINNAGTNIGSYFGKDSNNMYYLYKSYNQPDTLYKISLTDLSVTPLTSRTYKDIKKAIYFGGNIYAYGNSGFLKYNIGLNTWTTIDGGSNYTDIITDGNDLFLERADLGIYKYDISELTFVKIFDVSSINIKKFFEHKGKIYYYTYYLETGTDYETFIYDLSSGTLSKSTKAFVESIDGQTLFEIIDKTSLIEYGDGYQKTRTGLDINTDLAM